MKRPGKPAFPLHPGTYVEGAQEGDWSGMDMLDYFAGQALVMMGMWLPMSTGDETAAQAKARVAFDYAEAMIAEGEKRRADPRS